jgi:hypothetical protein
MILIFGVLTPLSTIFQLYHDKVDQLLAHGSLLLSPPLKRVVMI